MNVLNEYLRLAFCMRSEPFSLNRYQHYYLPSLERLLPWRSTQLPFICESWQDVFNHVYCRSVIYYDNLIQRHPRLLTKSDHFSECYDGNTVYLSLNAVRPDRWAERDVEAILAEKGDPRIIMYSRVVENSVAVKTHYSFPTMAVHMAENTRLLETLA